MEIKNVNLDRKPVDSEYIRSRQDFQQILKAYKSTANPVWKQPLFYGVIGFASIAAAVSFSLIDFNQHYGEKATNQQEEVLTHFVDRDAPAQKQEESYYQAVTASSQTNAAERVAPAVVRKGDDRIQIVNQPAVTSDVELADNVIAEHKPSKPGMPSISGAYEGTLDVSRLCNDEGIQSGSQVRVEAFTIQYYAGFNDNVMHVKGNRIPVEVCTAIEKSGGDQLVYITEIVGQGIQGNVSLPSMSFWIEVNG